MPHQQLERTGGCTLAIAQPRPDSTTPAQQRVLDYLPPQRRQPKRPGTHRRELSVIVPALDEAENLPVLVQRIHDALSAARIRYEILIVDDHSADGTFEVACELSQAFPVGVFRKQGARGKAQSLIEGMARARYGLIAMIDADLQCPPEIMPRMVRELDDGAGVVVARRVHSHVSRIRRAASSVFSWVFGRLLHGMRCDVQSGLKIFRTEIARRVSLHPSPWGFDLEFLVQARAAGYEIASVDMPFEERFSGKSKVRLAATSFELARSAVQLKIAKPCPIPLLPAVSGDARPLESGFHYKGKAYLPYNTLEADRTALYRVSRAQLALLAFGAAALIAGMCVDWRASATALVVLLCVLYLAHLLFDLLLVWRSFRHPQEAVASAEELSAPRNWPAYTILCPLYREQKVIPQFVDAMLALDYPAEQLQVMLLLEEDDLETRRAVAQTDLDGRFEVVVVPAGHPRTKPKACNFGLLRARGEYVVIYDAEDVPERDQLKRAVLAFEGSAPEVRCVQAKLNFYNPRQNLLTRLFTAEYSLWFDLMLTGLQSLGAPIPLGGTSNHFRRQDLLELGGWDACNVTEDCDLGIRLARGGYTTAIMDSTTFEEANSELKNWFAQRTRWIKGYIQTYLVHMRRPGELARCISSQFLAFQLLVGGKVLCAWLNPCLWLLTALYFSLRPQLGATIESIFPTPVLYPAVACLVAGNFLYAYYFMLGCAKRGYEDLIRWALFVPAYWLAMSGAAWMALVKLIYQPHYWAKTKHGLHLAPTSLHVAAAHPVNPARERPSQASQGLQCD